MSKDLATANTPPSPLRQLWYKLETTLRQPWDNNFEKNGPNQYQLWDNIGKTLGPHGDYLMERPSALWIAYGISPPFYLIAFTKKRNFSLP